MNPPGLTRHIQDVPSNVNVYRATLDMSTQIYSGWTCVL